MEKSLLLGVAKKGGTRTMPFIIATGVFERIATLGITPNMILYMTKQYGMENTDAVNVLFLWSAASDFLPIVGAVLADSYFGQYPMIAFGSIVNLLGVSLLWLTALVPKSSDLAFKGFRDSPQLMLLFASFGLLSIGAGGVRSCCIAFGADQLDNKDDPENASRLKRFFGLCFLSVSASALVATTCFAYVLEHYGWTTGFAVSVMLMLLSSLSFFMASSFYIKRTPKSSLLTSFLQVIVASVRNRSDQSSSQALADTDKVYHRDGKTWSRLRAPSEKLRFLNNACTMKESNRLLLTDGRSPDPWRVCTVEQVEDLKALINVIPIWSSGIMMALAMNQSSFSIIQAMSMDRHITSTFEVPTASFNVMLIVSLLLLFILNDSVFFPMLSKIVGKPVNPDLKQRIGLGLVLSILAIAILAIVEAIRRHFALDGITISAMCLLPYYMLMGSATGFSAISQNQLYYQELPSSMSSVAATLSSLGSSLGDVAASLLVSAVKKATESGRGDDDSWLSSDINRGHYDYYYWVIVGLSSLNLAYYVARSRAYGPCRREKDDGDRNSSVNREEESLE